MSWAIMHLSAAFILSLMAAVAGLFLMQGISPQNAEPWTFGLIYFLIFLVVLGVMHIMGYLLRLAFWRHGSKAAFRRSALRQAVLLGFLAVIALMLQAEALLNLQTGALLVAIFLLIELYAAQ